MSEILLRMAQILNPTPNLYTFSRPIIKEIPDYNDQNGQYLSFKDISEFIQIKTSNEVYDVFTDKIAELLDEGDSYQNYPIKFDPYDEGRSCDESCVCYKLSFSAVKEKGEWIFLCWDFTAFFPDNDIPIKTDFKFKEIMDRLKKR